MEDLRKQLSKVDQDILSLIAKRMSIIKKIGQFKIKKKIKIRHPEKEAELFNRCSRLAKKKGIDEGFILRIFRILVAESRRVQYQIKKEQ